MKYLRASLIAVALAAMGFGAASSVDNSIEQKAAACQKCGDGYCARSCENERTCPQDCGPSTAQ